MRARLALLMAALTILGAAAFLVVLAALARVRSANDELIDRLVPAHTSATALERAYLHLASDVASGRTGPAALAEEHQNLDRTQLALEPLLSADPSLTADLAAVERLGAQWTADPGGEADIDELRGALSTLSTHLTDRIARQHERVADATQAAVGAAAAFGVVLVVGGVVSARLLRRWISQPVQDLERQVGVVVGGDLSQPIVASGPSDLTSVGMAVEAMRQRLLAEASHRVGSALIAGHAAESARIAGQIHDDQVQAMTLASIRLQQLRRKLRDDPEALAVASTAEAAVNDAILRLRRMIFELHSPVLETDGLNAAVDTYLDETFGETVTWSVRGEPGPLDAGTAGLAYRLAREALFNAFKHAEPTTVEVTIERQPAALDVEVRDDGRGFDVAGITPDAGHLGLDHARQLAEAAGGWWRVESAPGRGTIVRFRLPAG